MLENFVYPQLQELQPAVFFQFNVTSPHWGLTGSASFDQHFPNQWIGCAGPISWPAKSPDITPCDFFLWVYVKDCVLNLDD
jgi:acyl-homoserine lactone acylase PvdQ